MWIPSKRNIRALWKRLTVALCSAAVVLGAACGEQDEAASHIIEEGLDRASWLIESDEATAADLLLALVASADLTKIEWSRAHDYRFEAPYPSRYENEETQRLGEHDVFKKSEDPVDTPSPDPAPEKEPRTSEGGNEGDPEGRQDRLGSESLAWKLVFRDRSSSSSLDSIKDRGEPISR